MVTRCDPIADILWVEISRLEGRPFDFYSLLYYVRLTNSPSLKFFWLYEHIVNTLFLLFTNFSKIVKDAAEYEFRCTNYKFF